jgi:phytoene synthase
MCAVYTFMRHRDGLSDGPGASGLALEEWRAALSQAFAGEMPPHPILPALTDTVAHYRIPRRYFYEMIEGVLTDLNPRRFEVCSRTCTNTATRWRPWWD